MIRSTVVSPIVWDDVTDRYDGLFVTLGYEERARYIASRGILDATKTVAWAFDENRVLSYQENARWFTTNGFETVEEHDGVPSHWINEACERADGRASKIRLAIDISSGTRRRIARWIEACSSCPKDNEIEVDFWYSMARYTPAVSTEAPNVAAGPVLPSFAGWADDPEAPTCLILGLGYEQDQAIGAVEYIEPGDILTFDPSGQDEEYADAIKAANAQLWNVRPIEPCRISYEPSSVFPTFLAVERTLSGLVRRSRPVLLPFGPKVFALAALLAARFHPSCAVWRVSQGALATPVQRMATGTIVGLRALFSSRDSAGPR